MYVAIPYVVFMEAIVSCWIHAEIIYHIWNPCFLLYFAIMWARVKLDHLCPSFRGNSKVGLCCI